MMIKKIFIFIILILPSCNLFNKSEHHYHRGFKSFEKKDYSVAIKYFSKSIELDDLNYHSIYMRGISYGLIHKYDSSLKDLLNITWLDRIWADSTIEERFSVCKDYYLMGMMKYYLRDDNFALEYLKQSVLFNPMELEDWNTVIEKKISKHFKFQYDIDYRTLYYECLILCGKMCMENNHLSESFYFFYKAKDFYRHRKIPYLMIQRASIKLGDSTDSDAIIKEYEQVLKSDQKRREDDAFFKIIWDNYNDSTSQDLRRESYESDRKEISYGIIQELKEKNPRFDIDSIYSLEN